MLFYKKPVADQESNGFVINAYDPCVPHKVINWTEITVCWHLDNLKVLHVDSREVTKFGGLTKCNLWSDSCHQQEKGAQLPGNDF